VEEFINVIPAKPVPGMNREPVYSLMVISGNFTCFSDGKEGKNNHKCKIISA
jgi:hypothetical protein